MSLRTEIRVAVDEVTPPAPHLASQVEAFVRSHSSRRGGSTGRKTNRWRSAFSGSLAMVAALLLITLVAAVLVGGRLFQDWNAFHNPAPAVPRVSLRELEARPLHIPIPASPNDCVSGPRVIDGYGSGPIYGNGGPQTPSAWGVYYYVYLYADSRVPGPVLVRAVHLFNSDPVVFVGPSAAGPVLQKDTVDGQTFDQHTEAFIDTSVTPNIGSEWTIGHHHRFMWPLIMGEPTVSAGPIFGFQIDGPHFTETFLVC